MLGTPKGHLHFPSNLSGSGVEPPPPSGEDLAAQTDLQRRRWLWGPAGAGGGLGRGSVRSLWRMAGGLPGVSGSFGQVREAAAGGISAATGQVTSDGSGGEGWRGSRKQLNKYRFASFLSAQHMVRACLIRGKLRQARVLNTTHFSVRSFASFFIHCITFPTDATFKSRDQFMGDASSSNKNPPAGFSLLTDTKALHSCLEKYQTALSFSKFL